MRKLALLILFSVMFVASGASAQVLTGWGDSPTNGAPTTEVFDCQSNSGTSMLVVSILMRNDLLGVTGFTVDLRALAGNGGVTGPSAIGTTRPMSLPPDWTVALPPYWDLSPHGCRAGALTMSAGFPGTPMGGSTTVTDPWQDALQFVTPVAWHSETYATYGPDMSPETLTVARCGLEGTLQAGTTVDLLAGHEYYVATFTIRHDKSASSGSCAGCCVPVEFQARVEVSAAGPTYAGGQGMPGLWQGWQNYNCSVVSTRTSTWGALKSAYR